jgi:hypothetical protein
MNAANEGHQHRATRPTAADLQTEMSQEEGLFRAPTLDGAVLISNRDFGAMPRRTGRIGFGLSKSPRRSRGVGKGPERRRSGRALVSK